MSKMMMIGSTLGFAFAMSAAGCNITSCEEGAYCADGKGPSNEDDRDEHEQCLSYCERLSICGAPQAREIEDCVEACEDRFQALPEETKQLCACTERSRCEDVIDGRCTDPGSGGSGSGGANASGGSGQGGAQTSGGSSQGGSYTAGGSLGNGGSPATGGAAPGGAPGSGGSAGCAGGPSTGGADAGGAGGEDPGVPCTCSCQCLSGQSCVSGYCA